MHETFDRTPLQHPTSVRYLRLRDHIELLGEIEYYAAERRPYVAFVRRGEGRICLGDHVYQGAAENAVWRAIRSWAAG